MKDWGGQGCNAALQVDTWPIRRPGSSRQGCRQQRRPTWASTLHTAKQSTAATPGTRQAGSCGIPCPCSLWRKLLTASVDGTTFKRILSRMSQVAKHKTKQDRIWVTYKDGVYDITDFVEGHPGGSARIMMAAGAGCIICNVLTVPFCTPLCTAPACHRLKPDALMQAHPSTLSGACTGSTRTPRCTRSWSSTALAPW